MSHPGIPGTDGRDLEIGCQILASFLLHALPRLPGWEIASHFQAAR